MKRSRPLIKLSSDASDHDKMLTKINHEVFDIFVNFDRITKKRYTIGDFVIEMKGIGFKLEYKSDGLHYDSDDMAPVLYSSRSSLYEMKFSKYYLPDRGSVVAGYFEFEVLVTTYRHLLLPIVDGEMVFEDQIGKIELIDHDGGVFEMPNRLPHELYMKIGEYL